MQNDNKQILHLVDFPTIYVAFSFILLYFYEFQ